MKTLCMLAGLLLSAPVLADPADQFDFWLGHWKLTWPQPDGTHASGDNLITEILDERIILEAFDGRPAMNLVGRSFTAYDTNEQRWKQTWVDNQGGYLDFVGGLEADGRMILARQFSKDGKTVHQRMVWFNISADSFDWHWESSVDGGETWTVLWPIHYQRRQDADD